MAELEAGEASFGTVLKPSSRIFPCKFIDRKKRTVEVRPYELEDYLLLEDMYDRFEPKRIAQGLPPKRDWVRHRWLTGILGTGHHVLAWVEGELAAHAVFFEMGSPDKAEWGVFVHQDYQGAGIGKLLSRLGKTWAAELGFSNVWLVVESFNERAKHVFKKSGYGTQSRMDMELDMGMAIEPELRELARGELVCPDASEFVKLVANHAPLDDETFPELAFIHSEFMREEYGREKPPFVVERSYLPLRICRRHGLLEPPVSAVYKASPVSFRIASAWHTPDYLLHLHLAGLGISTPAMGQYRLCSGMGTSFNELDRFSLLSCGASLLGARLLAKTPVKIAFNPCGGFHYAEKERSDKFCLINDTALAILYLITAGMKVFYLDLDAGHAHSIQTCFQDDERVLSCSLHEARGDGHEATALTEDAAPHASHRHVDIPLPAGTDSDIFKMAFDEIVPALAERFRPDVTVVQVGTNIMDSDSSPRLSITGKAYADTVSRVLLLAPKTLALGGCGQSLQHLARGLAMAWNAMVSKALECSQAAPNDPAVSPKTHDLIDISQEVPTPLQGRNRENIISQLNTTLYSIRQHNPFLK